MAGAAAMTNALVRMFLFPGDIGCSALGIGTAGHDLVRMLINSLFWAAVGAGIVALAV